MQNKEAVKELFEGISEKVGDRPGGYVRVIKTGFRQGDGAETAMIEFVDYNEVYVNPSKGTSGVSKTRRTRRGGKKKTSEGAAVTTAATLSDEAEDSISEENADSEQE